MQHFRWTEISGEKDCITCASLGEHTILHRKITLLEGNNASVKFWCDVCGFVSLGVVSVDGSEPQNSETSRSGGAHLLSLPDPLAYTDPAKQPKTDEEAMKMAFGEVIAPDSLEAILTNEYPQSVEIGKKTAKSMMTPYSINMGDHPVHGFVIEYELDGEIVFSRRHMETEGVPDMEAERKALQETCLSAVLRPTLPARRAAPPPRELQGPVVIVPTGYNSSPVVENTAASDDDAKIRSSLMNAFRG
jgi:hypothetical protein